MPAWYVIFENSGGRVQLLVCAQASRLVSYPVPEYTTLRNATFLHEQDLGTLAPNTIKTLRQVPAAAGGALDVLVSFDLSKLPANKGVARFGLALRAPAATSAASLAAAAQNVRRWAAVQVRAPLLRTILLRVCINVLSRFLHTPMHFAGGQRSHVHPGVV